MKKLLSLLLVFCGLTALANEVRFVKVPEHFGENEHFTVMLWAYVPAELGPIDAKGFGVKAFAFAGRGNMIDGVQFYIGENQGVPEFKCYTPDKGWNGIVKSNDKLKVGSKTISKKDFPEIKIGEWIHYAGVRDGNKMRLYINGKFVGECGELSPLPKAKGPVTLCAIKSSSAYWLYRFPGFVEKYAFENRSLSSDEIKSVFDLQNETLPFDMPTIRPYPKPILNKTLPIVQKWEQERKATPQWAENSVAKVVLSGGRPRMELNGKIVDVTLALPAVIKNHDVRTKTLKDFAAAGVKFYMDVWFSYTSLNDWWLGEGKYDFRAFDARMQSLFNACPDGYVIPRIKLDPPEWWRTQHPDEMLAGYINPASEKWHELFERMLRDVVEHIEKSPYAARIVGYNFGAMVGSEWISRRNDVPSDYDPEYWKNRADAISVPALKAARVIKEVSGGNKLTGVFFGYPIAEHGNLMQLVESPDIDFFCSPISYNGRRAGEPGRFSSQYQATFRLHGKLYWSEADERTHLSEYTGLWHPSWHHQNEFETEHAMMRDLAWALTSGHEIWWFTIAGSECFHDEGIMQTVKRGVEMASDRPDKPRISEVAVFTPVWYAPDPAEGRNKELKGSFLNTIVPTCGVPFDSYELSDLSNPNLPKYKAAIVLTGTHGYMPEPVDKDMKLWVIKNEKELPNNPEALQKWCVEMGAHVWCKSGDVFGAGCGYAFIHAATEGKKSITFPNGKGWKGQMKVGETKILKY